MDWQLEDRLAQLEAHQFVQPAEPWLERKAAIREDFEAFAAKVKAHSQDERVLAILNEVAAKLK